MNYNIFRPANTLQPFIDMYWQISGQLADVEAITLLPDGGINLCVNLGEDVQSVNFDNKIHHGGIFLVGPMLKTDVQMIRNEVHLLGVRFKPGGFSCFFKYDSLDLVANQFHEFPRNCFPDIKKTLKYFAPYLDQFFLDRLSPPGNSVLMCAKDIAQHTGPFSISGLAKRHFRSERQLERQFKQQIGIAPKQLADLERFHKAFNMLQANPKMRLEDLAWNCGYYDHAHLTNDFKRFVSQVPSAFILSDFSKEIAGEPR